jgi:hypothetical protein
MDIILDYLENEPVMFGLIEELDEDPLWIKENEDNQNKRKNKRPIKATR